MTDPSGVMNGGILSGIRVLDVGTYIFGPAAATVLSDFGAEVIKVESPPMGDPYRYLHQVPPMPVSEMDYFWILDGRNKKSLALDLRSEAGHEALLRLVRSADVFLTNFRVHALQKLKITYEDVKPFNERLIYAHATGYGEKGAEVEKPGYDMTAYWARSGLMDNVRNGEEDPGVPLAGMGDHPGSMGLFGGIMLALYARDRTGRGTKVTTSLMANGAWANACYLQARLCGGETYKRATQTTAFNALLNHYRSRDGKRFILCCVQAEKDWPRLCAATERTDLKDDAKFGSAQARREHSTELIAILNSVFAGRDMTEWAKRFEVHQVTWGPIATIDDVLADKQMEANGVFAEIEHPTHGRIRTINSPVHVAGLEKVKPAAAPTLGRDTRTILESVGYSPDEIQKMKADGIIVAAD